MFRQSPREVIRPVASAPEYRTGFGPLTELSAKIVGLGALGITFAT